MLDWLGIKYIGIILSPTYEEFIDFGDYPHNLVDRSVAFARDIQLLMQFDGKGMLELTELERRDMI